MLEIRNILLSFIFYVNVLCLRHFSLAAETSNKQTKLWYMSGCKIYLEKLESTQGAYDQQTQLRAPILLFDIS